MPGSHVILIDPTLERIVREAANQIAGLNDLLLGGKQYLEDKDLGDDFRGGVVTYTPRARRGYLEPAPISQVIMIHVRVDAAYATIIGLWLKDLQRGWGVPPTHAPSLDIG